MNGGAFIDGNNQVVFQQGLAAASITVESGAEINALAGSSYVALVAPRVVHEGTINVDGSAALVGAEAATITFSPDGLFTITTQVGTDDSGRRRRERRYRSPVRRAAAPVTTIASTRWQCRRTTH